MVNYFLSIFSEYRRSMRAVLTAALMACCSISLGAIAAINFDRLQLLAGQQYGARAQQNIIELRALLGQLQQTPEPEQLKKINEFVNRKIRIFDDDIKIWEKSDYWATPLESLGKEAGDCEDYSIAKYLFLRELGVSNDKLRLIYVRAQIGGPHSKIFQAHMVLGYYAQPNAEPLILDNMISDVRVASRRTDLRPVFSFNSDGLWVGNASNSRGDSSAHLSRWRDLLERAKNEGIE